MWPIYTKNIPKLGHGLSRLESRLRLFSISINPSLQGTSAVPAFVGGCWQRLHVEERDPFPALSSRSSAVPSGEFSLLAKGFSPESYRG